MVWMEQPCQFLWATEIASNMQCIFYFSDEEWLALTAIAMGYELAPTRTADGLVHRTWASRVADASPTQSQANELTPEETVAYLMATSSIPMAELEKALRETQQRRAEQEAEPPRRPKSRPLAMAVRVRDEFLQAAPSSPQA